ncbi:serine hydrolase domain-containing protein [Tunicatimonas pelagia]|uniref:serine hydrolase domain-containing protein n=1 Tax=Tunicatimonas pelagia TaxID=931531 RepID=UPI002666DA9B|nr:serine hydrolase domain-containing protein [Tunicatimonas pelagia]WKN41397.1 serine hydrolase [Tunicatimonas pelagia]
MTNLVLLHFIALFFGCQNPESIDAYLTQKHQEGKLNGNVLVIKDGETVYEKSFGYADGSKTTLLTEDYRFNIGSVYKEFPAVAIMQLVEKGQIKVDENIAKYIPELPKWSQEVTIKHLLQYSSGLPRIDWGSYFSQGINVTEAEIMDEIKNIEILDFEPGTDYLYTNNSPILLIKIVENVTNTNFNKYVTENIFIPYDMPSTVIKDQYPYEDRSLMAVPFDDEFDEDDYKLAVSGILFSSTARDLANWFQQLGYFEIVSEESVRFLSQEAKAGDNIQAPLGRCDWEDDEIIEHLHHGSSGNYECVVRRFKQEGITIAILTNQKHGNVNELSEEIYKIMKRNI